jgi:hypothetical protein
MHWKNLFLKRCKLTVSDLARNSPYSFRLCLSGLLPLHRKYCQTASCRNWQLIYSNRLHTQVLLSLQTIYHCQKLPTPALTKITRAILTQRNKLEQAYMEWTKSLLGRVVNSRWEHACLRNAITLVTKTASLKVENLARTGFKFSPVSFPAPQVCSYLSAIITISKATLKWTIRVWVEIAV